MACFLVPTTEAIVVTAVKTIEKKKDNDKTQGSDTKTAETKVSLTRKLSWLTNLLWGGAVLLAFEHIWHGEVTPWFPFLTAMADAEETSVMLHEMATVGVTMAVLITVVWIGMCVAADAIMKRDPAKAAENAR